jgi:hypothetical protein
VSCPPSNHVNIHQDWSWESGYRWQQQQQHRCGLWCSSQNICGTWKTEVVCQVGTSFAEKKAALVIQFSSHSAVASYQSSSLSLAGCPTGIVATWSWISPDSPRQNLMMMASLSVCLASLMRSQNSSVYLSTVWCPWWYSAVSSQVSALWALLFGQNVLQSLPGMQTATSTAEPHFWLHTKVPGQHTGLLFLLSCMTMPNVPWMSHW